MQIRINQKYNQKMLQNYPDDPYSDLSIFTQTRRLNLVLTYLSIDSTYFAQIDPDTRQVNLRHLNQQPLLRVIRSLYGEKLTANTISQLSELYEIIKQLEVQDYKANIQRQVLEKDYIMESIQFLEFSFTNDLLVDRVMQFHIESKLKLLENNRNYLQLTKISMQTFQILVQKFIESTIQKYGSIQTLLIKPQSQIVNHVMQNYFNRNNIKAMNYFKQATCGNCDHMEAIWNKYHHSLYFTSASTTSIGDSMVYASSIRGLPSQYLTVNTKSPQMQKLRKKSQETLTVNNNGINPGASSLSPQIQKKKKKVQQLQQQLKERDSIITELQRQIAHTKQLRQAQTHKLGKRFSGGNTVKTMVVSQFVDQQLLMKQPFQDQSLSYLPNTKKNTRKSKQYDQGEDFTVSSVFEPAFNRKIPEMKQVRTMKKVTGMRNKFLPN